MQISSKLDTLLIYMEKIAVRKLYTETFWLEQYSFMRFYKLEGMDNCSLSALLKLFDVAFV